MKTDIQNLDGIVDQSLKVASRVIAVVAFPAILFAASHLRGSRAGESKA